MTEYEKLNALREKLGHGRRTFTEDEIKMLTKLVDEKIKKVDKPVYIISRYAVPYYYTDNTNKKVVVFRTFEEAQKDYDLMIKIYEDAKIPAVVALKQQLKVTSTTISQLTGDGYEFEYRSKTIK